MNLAKQILTALLSGSANYRGLYRRMSENGTRPVIKYEIIDFKKVKESYLRITLSRLKKRGLLENENRIWKITKKGIKHLKMTALKAPHFRPKSSNMVKNKNLIVIFDIPEINHKRRDWLRVELRNLGFILLQKSVWFGPTPLPKEFIRHISEANILQYIKFFKAEEKDII